MKLYRHRIQVPATVVFDIITDTPEVPDNYVQAVASGNFNLDEGNGLDRPILDGRHARLYLTTGEKGLNIKEFTVEDVNEEEGEDSPDVEVCTVCSDVIPSEFKEEHEKHECPVGGGR